MALSNKKREQLGLGQGQTFQDKFGFKAKKAGKAGMNAIVDNIGSFDPEKQTFSGVNANTALTKKGKSIFDSSGAFQVKGNRDKLLNQQAGDVTQGVVDAAQDDTFEIDAPDSGVSGPNGIQSVLGQIATQPNPYVDSAASALFSNQAAASQGAGLAMQDREAAMQELQQLQRQALSPELDPVARQMFQDRADERRAEVLSRFDEGGDINDVFSRQRGVDLADLASRGVLDSTTASNTFSDRDAKLGGLANQLLGDASELSRQEALGERNRIGETATQFGGLQAGQSQSAGNLFNSLLGTGSSAANAAGSLGNQSMANSIQALLGSGQLGLDSRGLEADLQLAERGQQQADRGFAFDIIQSLINNRFNRKAGRQGMSLQEELLSRMGESQGGGGIPGIPFI